MKCGNPSCSNSAVKKFCSKSCAATVNNTGRVRIVKTCKQCPNRVPRSENTFCSSDCHREHVKGVRLQKWLNEDPDQVNSIQAKYIREFILTDQGGVCDICGIEPMWNGTGLTFVLDHIDGNSEDNRRGNLRLVCPNCDSQLPTYKAKNRGNGRHWRRERYKNGQSY